MPQIFKIGGYFVYFWSNENLPPEPVHVHISYGAPAQNATKVWITRAGKCLLCHNRSQIRAQDLADLLRVIEARSGEVVEEWQGRFGEVTYYC